MNTAALVKAGWVKRQESRTEWSYTSPSGRVQVWTRRGWSHGVEISVGERRAGGHLSTAFALRAESLVSRWV